jgi:cell wall assembly regulator SMI1
MINYMKPIFDRLQDCWDPISEDQLAQLERDVGSRFPSDYRDFLLHFNGGYWSHVVKSRALRPSRTLNEIPISANLGCVDDDRFTSDDIRSDKAAYADRIPDSFVPIMDAMGDPVCIDLAPEGYGNVYYWDRSDEGVDRGNRANLLANSFGEFIDSLTPYTELETYSEELPTFQAAERGDRQAIIDYLVGRGLCDIRNDRGWTLMMCAAHNSWPRVVDILARVGADPNAVDNDGWTPLHHAVWGQSLDSVKHLLLAGADTSYRDSEGRNLAQIAKDLHHYRIYYHLAPYMPYP